MRKFATLLCIVFLFIPPILAQSNERNQEVYDQLKEWAIVKLTIAYIEDLKGWSPQTENTDTDEYKTYIRLIDNYQEFSNDKEINLENVGELLETGDWSKTKTNVFNLYKEFVKDSEYSFNDISVVGYTEGMTTESFDETIAALNNKYEELLSYKKNIKEGDVEKSKTESSSGTSANEVTTKTSKLSFGIYGIIIVVVIIIFIFLLMKDKMRHNINKGNNDPYNNSLDYKDSTILQLIDDMEGSKVKVDSLNQSIKRFEKEIKDLRDEVRNLKNEVDNLKKGRFENNSYPMNTSTNSDSMNVQTHSNIIDDTPSQPISLDVSQSTNVSQSISNNLIYLPSPFQDMTFSNEDASKDRTLNSLYMIEFNEQMKIGELSILVDADLSKALNSPDTYLKTACTYDNDYSNTAKAIKVTDKGSIKLEGEDWKVTKKVRIKFI